MMIRTNQYNVIIISTLMRQIKIALITPNHLNELLYLMAHHRVMTILAVLATQQQKNFYNFVNLNLKYTNIQCQTFASIKQAPQRTIGKIFILMDIPATFQEMKELLTISKQSSETIIVLLKENKKYINMIKKKIGNGQFQIVLAEYSTNRFVGINQKVRELVEKSFDMNRAAFYAYGAYINNFRANLLKFIFKTQAINVSHLASSFGFTAPPRVKQGKFLKVQTQMEKINQKLKLKRQIRKEHQQHHEQQRNTQFITNEKMSPNNKLTVRTVKKTKIINKNKQRLIKSKVQSTQKSKNNPEKLLLKQ